MTRSEEHLPSSVAQPCAEQHRTDWVCIDCAGPRAARKERERIVRWLRNAAAEYKRFPDGELQGDTVSNFADWIDRGDHHAK